MNFLQRLKEELNDPKNCMGQREKVLVSTKALRELLYHFETLDSYERATHKETRKQHINEQLRHTICASYHQQGKNTETTLMLIMDTLRPLMEERHKEKEMVRFNGS